MTQGTTPTHVFKLPFETSAIKELKIIYNQGEVEVLNFGIDDCELEGNTVSVTLTQEDTFAFDHEKDVLIQLRVLTHEGVALASGIKVLDVKECLNDEVMG